MKQVIIILLKIIFWSIAISAAFVGTRMAILDKNKIHILDWLLYSIGLTLWITERMLLKLLGGYYSIWFVNRTSIAWKIIALGVCIIGVSK